METQRFTLQHHMAYADKIEVLLENGALACMTNKVGKTAKDVRMAVLKSHRQYTAFLVPESIRSAQMSRMQPDGLMARLEAAAREERVPPELSNEADSLENEKQDLVTVDSDVEREGLHREDLRLKINFPIAETAEGM